MRLLGCLLAVLAIGCHGGAPSGEGGRKVLYWKSPMDPSFVSKQPGKDAMGMDLVPVYEGEAGADLRTIRIDGATIQRMGMRVAPVKRARLTRIVRALGRVEFDETRVTRVNMKFDGWIEKLWVNETGQFVRRGEPLFAIYSPELLASEEEYLQAIKVAGEGPHSQHLVAAARQRLLQFDVPRSFVDEITRNGKPERRVVITAPASGYVVHKTAFEGTFVKKGADLFTITDLNALWVMADVYEFDAPWVLAGQDATVELDYLPGQVEEAKVDYVYPTLNQTTRTIQVRLILPNPTVVLKPGMFATVRIHTEPAGNALVVPSEAVIQSGERALVFVDRGEGRFEPQDVKLGVEGTDQYEVRSGLKEGERVVTSGQFLLDSESNLKEAAQRLLGTNLAPSPSPMPAGEGRSPPPATRQAMPGMEMPEPAAPRHEGRDAR